MPARSILQRLTVAEMSTILRDKGVPVPRGARRQQVCDLMERHRLTSTARLAPWLDALPRGCAPPRKGGPRSPRVAPKPRSKPHRPHPQPDTSQLSTLLAQLAVQLASCLQATLPPLRPVPAQSAEERAPYIRSVVDGRIGELLSKARDTSGVRDLMQDYAGAVRRLQSAQDTVDALATRARRV